MLKELYKYLMPAALIAVTFIAIHQCNRANRAVELSKNNKEQVKLAAEIVERAVDSTGREYVDYKPNVVPPDALSNPIDSVVRDALDSASEELKNVLKEREIDKQTIQEYRAVNARLSAKLKGTAKDTVIIYKDKTLSWVYNPTDTVLDLDIDVSSKNLSTYDGRKILGFNIGTTTLYNTIWWNDPRIRINSIDHIIVESKIPQNKFLLSGKSEYRFNADELWLGSEAELKLNRFGIYGNYMYNPADNIHEKSAGLKYYIFK